MPSPELGGGHAAARVHHASRRRSGGVAARRARAAAERVRRIGVLLQFPESDRAGQARAAAMVQHLGALGWHDGNNLRIDWRWAVPILRSLSATRRNSYRFVPT